MRNLRKMIASLSVVAILSSLVVSTAFAASFGDVTASDEWYGPLNDLVEAGVVDGSQANFRPYDKLTRAEAATYVVRLAGFTLEEPTSATFADVPTTHPAFKYIETAAKHNVLKGYGHKPGYFGPDDAVTRSQFAKIVVEGLGLDLYTPATATFPDVPFGTDLGQYVETVAHYGIVKGYANGNFGPADNIIRGHSALMLDRSSDVEPGEEEEEEDEDDGFELGGDTEGSIEDVTVASADESEALEGEEEVEVYAVDVELDDNGPLQLQRVDVWFGEDDTAGASSKPWDYFDEVSLTVEGEIVATIDTGSSTGWSSKSTTGPIGSGTPPTNQYRLRFTGLEETLPSDETTKLAVLVTVKDSLDSDDEGATWYTELTELRVMDETGFVTSYDAEDENSGGTEALEEAFGMDEATVADLEVRDADDEIDAQVIEVSKTSDTNGVEIYAFEIEETEGIDVNISELTLTFATVDAISAGATLGDIESNVIKKAYLLQDGEVVGTESMTSTGLVVFDNVDIDIAGDATEEFTVEVDLEDTNDDARYNEGTTLTVSVTSLDEMEDENGNDEDDVTTDVDADGNTHELRSEGVQFEFVSAKATATTPVEGESQQGEFEITFKATAFGEDTRLAAGADCDTLTYAVTGGTAPDAVCDLDSSSTDSEDVAGTTFELDRGVTRTFTASFVVTPDETGFYKVAITEFTWGATTGLENDYDFDMGDYKTGSKSLTFVP